jgi:aspartyl-tRNA(Asn)/glutamyl-tRNA(Gln) amidotransferase subunit C
VSKPHITPEEVRRVARLARIHLEDDQVEPLRQDLESILTYVDQLAELDLSGVEPTTGAGDLEAALRADEVVKTLSRQQVLANAPEQEDGMFRVPRIVEGGN